MDPRSDTTETPPPASGAGGIAWGGVLFRTAPLVPVAVAVTLGLVGDRYVGLPVPLGLGFALLAVVGWVVTRFGRDAEPAHLFLWAACAGLGAAWHHAYRENYPADDIGEIAADEPQLARLRGSLADEPAVFHRPRNPALVTVPRTDPTVVVLGVSEFQDSGEWRAASGWLVLASDASLEGLHAGDEVEVVGWLARPSGPSNPGEWDYAARLQDQRVRAVLRVPKSAEGVVRLTERWRGTLAGRLAEVRGWGQRGLQEALPRGEAGVAAALLLGESSAMTGDGWDRYVRTGVVHALAISGQHLVVLGGFAWFVLRLAGVRRRRGALAVALGLLGYALLTGGRPSVMRAAVTVCAVCGGVLIGRRALPANAFALAWLVVVALNPTDPFTAGCQLSFVAVAVLVWGVSRWLKPRELTPLEELIEESRPPWEKALRGAVRFVIQAFAVSLILFLALTPLLISWQNLVSPIAVLIGPPVIFFTSVALVGGFLTLLAQALGGLLVPPFAFVTHWSLSACEWLVDIADGIPGGHWYSAGVPTWWLVGFYGCLAALLLLRKDEGGIGEGETPERFAAFAFHPSSFLLHPSLRRVVVRRVGRRGGPCDAG